MPLRIRVDSGTSSRSLTTGLLTVAVTPRPAGDDVLPVMDPVEVALALRTVLAYLLTDRVAAALMVERRPAI